MDNSTNKPCGNGEHSSGRINLFAIIYENPLLPLRIIPKGNIFLLIYLCSGLDMCKCVFQERP